MSKTWKQLKSTSPDKPNVFVMTLSKGQIEANTVVDLVAMLMTSKVEANFLHMNSTYVQQGRDTSIQLAIDQGGSHILFIDSDMMFPAHTLDTLLEADLDVVACNYASRTQPGKPVAYIDEEPYYCRDGTSQYQEITSVGMGVCLIKTKVFDKIPAPRCFMPWDKDANIYVGEDVYLCHVIRQAGFHIWIDNELSKEVKHIGKVELETP